MTVTAAAALEVECAVTADVAEPVVGEAFGPNDFKELDDGIVAVDMLLPLLVVDEEVRLQP